MKVLNRRAQSIIEYIGALIVVAVALVAIGIYYQRSLQGKYRETGEFLSGGQQFTVYEEEKK